MKKDYQWAVWLIIFSIAVLASSCSKVYSDGRDERVYNVVYQNKTVKYTAPVKIKFNEEWVTNPNFREENFQGYWNSNTFFVTNHPDVKHICVTRKKMRVKTNFCTKIYTLKK